MGNHYTAHLSLLLFAYCLKTNWNYFYNLIIAKRYFCSKPNVLVIDLPSQHWLKNSLSASTQKHLRFVSVIAVGQLLTFIVHNTTILWEIFIATKVNKKTPGSTFLIFFLREKNHPAKLFIPSFLIQKMKFANLLSSAFALSLLKLQLFTWY